MDLKDKGIVIITLTSVILFVIDLYSTLINKNLYQHLESNPLYPYIGITGIALLNIAVFTSLYLWYSKTKNIETRYTIIMVLTTICLVRVIVIWNNFEIASNPPTVEQAKAVTTVMKQQHLFKVLLQGLMPYFAGFVSFILFKADHNIKRRKDDG